MSTNQEKEYYRKYMKQYYGTHKDYWRNYYLEKKGSQKKSKSSYRNRRFYLAKISAAWYRPQKKKSRIGRLIRRLGRTSPSQVKSNRLKTSSSNMNRDNVESVKELRNILLGILGREKFLNIKFLENNFEKIPSKNLSKFQALAEKNNEKCMIEFVTSPFKVFTEKRKEHLYTFLDFFDTRFFLCFIKPDISKYCILEVERNNIKSVTLGLKAIDAMNPIPEFT